MQKTSLLFSKRLYISSQRIFVKNPSKVFSTTNTKIRVPAILSDIDGVVYRGGHEIGNSKKVIKALLNQNVENHKGLKVPFALLTNGGGIPESERAKYVNKIIGLDKEDQGKVRVLEGQDMILCHSPFREEHLVENYKDKFVLVSGLGRMIELA